ncbi:hypothetical protein [Virgibacillus proomii]|uniref:hypothetical protein n=1 Tax=Virgibacillus proomii TaxID=84407 RepID=UPI001C11A045|nr:hypothetical protein [Virgibacillus proomii]MBU5265715.1 hypothetical protein [Virgibacillus proomii]
MRGKSFQHIISEYINNTVTTTTYSRKNFKNKVVISINNRRNMMTLLLAMSAAGAIIYGVRNETFQRWQQTISNAMNDPQIQIDVT